MKPSEALPNRIVFFDGVCHLCNGFVDAVIVRDPAHHFAFAPLQGSTAEKLLPAKDRENLASVLYYENGKLYRQSLAVLKILSSLPGAYKMLKLFYLIPGPVRDLLYRFVARHRYSWFGERDFCRLPLPHEKSFLLP